MSEILQYAITSLITFLTTGGIGSIFLFRLQKRMRVAEVKAAEVDVKTKEIANLSQSNEEWIKLYNTSVEEKNRLADEKNDLVEKLNNAYKSKDDLFEKYSISRSECSERDLKIQELNWYRCEINGCPYRKPPRRFGESNFPKDGINPVEYPDSNVL